LLPLGEWVGRRDWFKCDVEKQGEGFVPCGGVTVFAGGGFVDYESVKDEWKEGSVINEQSSF
jgi:hypothetical protein